jgi:Tfp pilus assembly protein PilZ
MGQQTGEMILKPFDEGLQFVFRNVEEFAAAFQSPLWPGGVFYRTYRAFRLRQAVTIKVSLGRGKPPLLLDGTVSYRQRGKRRPLIVGGVGIDLHASALPKVEYLLQLPRGDQKIGQDGANRRRHHRLPLDFPVSWQRNWSEPALARLGDIGFGGAFIKDVDSLPVGGDLFLKIFVPGTAVPTVISARVAWIRYDGPPGFGVKWRARDTGGLRLIREMVSRIKMPPASDRY